VKSFHLAGIIPVAGQKSNFNLPWHDTMMPIAPNYFAVERSVVECAYAGCKTIWIVCNDDVEPLIRHKIGDYVKDPVWLNRSQYGTRPKNEIKEIPIFYVPVHAKDRGKRDCLPWSVLYGALTAYHISKQISKWLKPRKYYVSFPMGVYPPEYLRQYRNKISNKSGFHLSYQGKTIKDGEPIGFTFDEEDYKKFMKKIREGTGEYIKGQTFSNNQGPRKRLPIEERWSARNFTLHDVFNIADINNSEIVEVEWFYKIDSWEDYCYYLGSDDSKKIKRPSEIILSYNEFNEIGVDNEDDV
jgi:hypothetical protein